MSLRLGTFVRAGFLFVGALFASTASAEGLDATGTFKGAATENFTCTNGDVGVRNLQTVMVVNGSSSGAFNASTSFVGTQTLNGVTTPFSNQASPFVGNVAADGTTVAQFQSVPPIVTTGTLSGDTWTLSYVTVFGICTFTLNMVIVRNSVVPTESPSGLITGSATLLSSTRAITALQQVRIGNIIKGGEVGASTNGDGFLLQGMAAGDEVSVPIGIWGNFSRTDSENDFTSTAFESERYTLLGGVDVLLDDWIVVGLAVGFENADVDTRFNSGNLNTDGYTVSPYAALILTDQLLVDASIGVTTLDTDQFRTSVSNTGARTRVNSSFNSWRSFFAMNASYSTEVGDLLATARVGYLRAIESQPNYAESNGTQVQEFRFRLSQVLLGADLTYTLGDFEPYAHATYERDVSVTQVQFSGGVAQPESDLSGVVTGFGVRYFGAHGITGQLEYSTVLGRSNLTEHQGSMLIRVDF